MNALKPEDRQKIIELFQISYQEATSNNGLIAFTKKIRGPENDMSGKYSLKARDLAKLFDTRVWKEQKTGSGHRKLENRITKITVEYADHDNRANIDPGASLTILDAVQKHLNLLGDEIFEYHLKNWKSEPDYQASLRRYLDLTSPS